MPNLIDLSGQRFGRLTVTGRAVSQKGATRWLCQCDCGNDTVVFAVSLLHGVTRSCGCLAKQPARATGPVDLVGRRFGKLTVTARHPIKRLGWDCVCDCGNTTTVHTTHLIRGTTRSCGCGMNQKLDLVGQRFGHYTVIERHMVAHNLKWKCRCDCGTVVEKTTWQLRNRPDDGHHGCPWGPGTFEVGQSGRPIDLTGQTFGRLHVLRFDPEATDRQLVPMAMWVCRCECGTVKTIRGASLTSGATRSCGSTACRRILRARGAALWVTE